MKPSTVRGCNGWSVIYLPGIVFALVSVFDLGVGVTRASTPPLPIPRGQTHGRLQWAFVTADGKQLPIAFDGADRFSEGLAPACKGDRWGFVDANGNWAVNPAYVAVRCFSGGRAAVMDHYSGLLHDTPNWGFIDVTGKVVVKPQYAQVTDFSDGLASVGRQYIDASGAVVKDSGYSCTQQFSEGLSRVADYQGANPRYIDVHNTVVVRVPPELGKHAWATTFHDRCARVECGTLGGHSRSYTYIGRDGKRISDVWYENAEDFSEQLAAVKINGSWGYIDPTGKVRIQPGFQGDPFDSYNGDRLAFHQGLAIARTAERSGYIKPDGSWAFTVDRKLELTPFDASGLALFCEKLSPPTTKPLTAQSVIRLRIGAMNREGKIVVDNTFEVGTSDWFPADLFRSLLQ